MTSSSSPSSSQPSYDVILEDALKDIGAEKYNDAVARVEKAAALEQDEKGEERLMDLLISKLLLSSSSSVVATTDTTENHPNTNTNTNTNNSGYYYLQLVVLLVQRQAKTNKNWMIPISKSLLKFCLEKENESDADIPVPDIKLLQVWMQQIIVTDSSVIQSNLTQALLALVATCGSTDDESLMVSILEILQNLWKTALEDPKSSLEDAAVKCAHIFVQLWSSLPSSSSSPDTTTIKTMANDLLLPMLTNNEDPLLQISVLDMILQEVQQQQEQQEQQQNDDASNASLVLFKTWLAQSLPWQEQLLTSSSDFAFASAVPLAALVFDDLSPNNQTYLLNHVIKDEIGMTTNETNRLLVCQTLLTIFGGNGNKHRAHAHIVLLQDDETLRKCWWDMSRLHVPKLQAAVMISVSQLLIEKQQQQQQEPQHSDDDSGMKLYRLFGADNNSSISTTTTTTTEWIYNKFVKSPLPELRIAAYTLWTTVLTHIPNGGMVFLTPSSSWNGDDNDDDTTSFNAISLLEWLQRRETTHDARAAKFETVLAMQKCSTFVSSWLLFWSSSSSSTTTSGGGTSTSATADPTKLLEKVLSKQIELGPHGMEPLRWDTMMVE